MLMSQSQIFYLITCHVNSSLGLSELQACPFPDVFPSLFLSALSSSPIHCALQDGFGQTWWTGHMSIALQFASLYDGQEVFLSDCLLDLSTDFPVGNKVYLWDAKNLAVAPHFHGLYSSLHCCEGPSFTIIQEDGCDKGAHRSYLGTEDKMLLSFQNWFQPCQCCCLLCSPGEYLRLGTLVSYKWAQVLEACDCLKLLSINLNPCVDATGIVCHQLGLIGTNLCAVCCRGFVELLH